MDLYLWKAPVIDDADKAGALIDRYFDGEKTVFEPNNDVPAMAAKLRAAYSDDPADSPSDDCPWATLPIEEDGRLLVLNIRWSADNAVLDTIIDLAKQHDLVVYDPQGPDVYRAVDAPEDQPAEKPTAKDFLNVILLFLPIAGATFAAWWFIPWPWLRWPLVVIGTFFSIAAFIVVYATVEAAFHQPGDKPSAS